jgi:hypothetical protein
VKSGFSTSPGDLRGPLREKTGRGGVSPGKERIMAKGQKKSNKEVRKPKAEKAKTNASNPTMKGLVESTKR